MRFVECVANIPYPVPGAPVIKSLTANKENADVQYMSVDTSKTASIDALAAAVKDKYDGKIDLLVRLASA